MSSADGGLNLLSDGSSTTKGFSLGLVGLTRAFTDGSVVVDAPFESRVGYFLSLEGPLNFFIFHSKV